MGSTFNSFLFEKGTYNCSLVSIFLLDLSIFIDLLKLGTLCFSLMRGGSFKDHLITLEEPKTASL